MFDLSEIDAQFFVEDFKLPEKFFKIFSYEHEVMEENNKLQKQLGIVEALLVKQVSQNFD